MSRLLLFLSLLPVSAPARADCWASYDQGLRDIMRNAGYSTSDRAASFGSMQECESAVRAMLSDPQYRGDAYLARTTCHCDGSSYGGGGSRAPAAASFQQQVVAVAMNSFFNALFASLSAPSGPSAEELRAKAQSEWAGLEKVRLASEKRLEEKAFGAKKSDALGLLASRPASAPPPRADAESPDGSDGARVGEGGVPSLLRGKVSDAEWSRMRTVQRRIEELSGKRPRTPAEEAELSRLEAERRPIWRGAVSVPGLPPEDRDRLRLSLAREGSPSVSAGLDEVLAAREKASGGRSRHLATAMGESLATYGAGAALEQAADGLTGALSKGEGLAFGDAYAVGGVGMALVQGGPEAAATPAANWLLGRIPGAGLATATAQGVGQVTASAMRRSWDHFVEETEKVVPGVLPEGGADAFWKGMKEEATSGQRAVFESLGL